MYKFYYGLGKFMDKFVIDVLMDVDVIMWVVD